MDEQYKVGDGAPAEPRQAAARSSKNHRTRNAASSTTRAQVIASQVSLTLPRDVLESYEAISRETGVNRAHLMREALQMYAALLANGQRVYQLPGIRRVA